MRKAAFALSIVGVFPGIVLAVLYFPWALFSPSPELALLVAYCLATSVVCVVTAYLNSKASFKSSIIAPAVVSVLLGGIFGLVSGILLLAAREEAYFKPIG